jgi:hypothetical protein
MQYATADIPHIIITSEMILTVFSAKFFQAIFEKKDRSYAFNSMHFPEAL